MAVNVKNLIALKERLETLSEDRFSMDVFRREYKCPQCNTTHCIAGEAVTLRPDFKEFDLSDSSEYEGYIELDSVFLTGREKSVSIEDAAQEYLGLDDKDAFWLFYGEFSDKALSDIPVEEAIDAVEALIYDLPIG